MKKEFILSAAALFAVAANAQTVSDSAVAGAQNVNVVYYSLPNGAVRTEPINNWELGFEIGGNTSSILANTQNATMRVYQSPYKVDEWGSVDTAGYTSWQRLDDAPETWSEGALNSNVGAGGSFDLGWGVYDFAGENGPAHAVNGDSIFLVRQVDGSFKKLRIDRLYSSAYSFTWADLDGSNEQKDTIAKADYQGKNFGYYSLSNSAELDREPATADWDILFTRYITFDYGSGPGTPQAVTGVLLNKGVKAVKVPDVALNEADFNNYLNDFVADRNTIGHNWKYLNASFAWAAQDSLSFFVRRPANGEIWKIVFTGFSGNATGIYRFNKELVLEAPEATATAASLSACAGETVLLTANGGTGYTYQWYKGTTAVADATEQTFEAGEAGDYSVRVTDRGAFAQSTALAVTILPAPSVNTTPVNPLCAGSANGSISVTATSGTGASYFTWGDNSTGASKTDLAAGTYTVYATDAEGCDSEVETVTLTEPTALSAAAAASNSSATASVSGGTAPYTFVWSDASGQTTATASALPDGDYTVTVTDANGCSTTAAVTVATTAIRNVDANIISFAVLPNPSNGQFAVSLATENNTDVTVTITDITGRTVYEIAEKNSKSFVKPVNLTSLNKGVYLVTAKTVNGTVTERLIIQ